MADVQPPAPHCARAECGRSHKRRAPVLSAPACTGCAQPQPWSPGGGILPQRDRRRHPRMGRGLWRAPDHLRLGAGARTKTRTRVARSQIRDWRVAKRTHGSRPVLDLQRGDRGGRANAAAGTDARAPQPLGSGGHPRRSDRMDASVRRCPHHGRLGPYACATPRPRVANRSLSPRGLAERTYGSRSLRFVCQGRRGGGSGRSPSQRPARSATLRAVIQSSRSSPSVWRIQRSGNRRSRDQPQSARAGASEPRPRGASRRPHRPRRLRPGLGRSVRIGLITQRRVLVSRDGTNARSTDPRSSRG
jgi:hypothetical protein